MPVLDDHLPFYEESEPSESLVELPAPGETRLLLQSTNRLPGRGGFGDDLVVNIDDGSDTGGAPDVFVGLPERPDTSNGMPNAWLRGGPALRFDEVSTTDSPMIQVNRTNYGVNVSLVAPGQLENNNNSAPYRRSEPVVMLCTAGLLWIIAMASCFYRI